MEYAGFWRRVAAYIIDGIILSFVSLAFSELFMDDLKPEIPWEMLGELYAFGAFFALYHAIFESSKFQATPGKMAIGVIVTDLHGNRISLVRAIGRDLGKFVSINIMGVGVMMAGWGDRKQALHDVMADCLVIRKPKEEAIEITAEEQDWKIPESVSSSDLRVVSILKFKIRPVLLILWGVLALLWISFVFVWFGHPIPIAIFGIYPALAVLGLGSFIYWGWESHAKKNPAN